LKYVGTNDEHKPILVSLIDIVILRKGNSQAKPIGMDPFEPNF